MMDVGRHYLLYLYYFYIEIIRKKRGRGRTVIGVVNTRKITKMVKIITEHTEMAFPAPHR